METIIAIIIAIILLILVKILLDIDDINDIERDFTNNNDCLFQIFLDKKYIDKFNYFKISIKNFPNFKNEYNDNLSYFYIIKVSRYKNFGYRPLIFIKDKKNIKVVLNNIKKWNEITANSNKFLNGIDTVSFLNYKFNP